MRVSVPDLADARRAYVEALGLQVVEDRQLHTPEDEAMWGLAGAQASSLMLRADNFLLELVEYHSPGRPPGPMAIVLPTRAS
jgi:catechol 2,3-dioxygenase-like lactoylglutathione lyase family enzyme